MSNRATKNKPITKEDIMRRAVKAILIPLGLAFVAVIISLINIMFIKGDNYHSKALEQQTRTTTISAKRGTIYDRNMETLVESITVYTVYVSPGDMDDKQKQTVAEGLSEILDMDKDDLLEACNSSTYYKIIKRNVESEEANKVRDFAIENKLSACIGLDESTKRYYPNENLVSNVLGFTGTDNVGLYGLELYYNDVLSGTDGRKVAIKNAIGADMPFTYENIIDAVDGNDLVLTIDEGIQYFVEKYLDLAVKENKVANRGCCIAMDPNTAEILAMATKGDYNPNDPFVIADKTERKEIAHTKSKKKAAKLKSAAQVKQWTNKAVSETYTPGSVFKIFTGSAAYEEGLINENSTFSCPGYVVVAGVRIGCHKTEGHGNVNLVNAYVGSCNPAFIKIGLKLGSETFYDYYEAFGFTEKTGVDLPAEASSIYFKDKDLTAVRLASEAFGQTMAITPIQMITAVSSIANGGKLLQPYIVKQVLDEDGNIIKNTEPIIKRQVVSEHTAKAISAMLNEVIHSGSGRNASIAGYEIAGKTGTSEKITDEEKTGKDVASFCAFAPVDNPQIVILLILDEPNGASTYGGVIASPVVGQMLEEILPYMGIEPTYSEEELKHLDVSTPSIVGMSLESAKDKLRNNGLEYSVVGSGKKVIKQIPEAGETIPTGGTVVIYTQQKKSTKVTVPDFSTMSVSGVNAEAANSGINVKFSGSYKTSGAYAYKQSVKAGEKIDKGTIVTVYFRYNDNVE
jgi:stage V sporulation protein D (sporulation-specific penicillin-binding protein)